MYMYMYIYIYIYMFAVRVYTCYISPAAPQAFAQSRATLQPAPGLPSIARAPRLGAKGARPARVGSVVSQRG